VTAISTRGDTSQPYQREGEFLAAKRKARLDGLKISEVARQFAEMTGKKFHRNSIDHWESGRRQAGDREVVILALIYGNITPPELEHDMRRPSAARLLEHVQEHGAPELGIPARNAAPAYDSAPDLDQLTDRQRRQIEEIQAMKGVTDGQKQIMITALMKHYESTADLIDAQLGIDTVS
jgi:hypothetical protein